MFQRFTQALHAVAGQFISPALTMSRHHQSVPTNPLGTPLAVLKDCEEAATNHGD